MEAKELYNYLVEIIEDRKLKEDSLSLSLLDEICHHCVKMEEHTKPENYLRLVHSGFAVGTNILLETTLPSLQQQFKHNDVVSFSYRNTICFFHSAEEVSSVFENLTLVSQILQAKSYSLL